MGAMQDRRTLIVMRHAKAGELPGGPDFERALRPRGQRDSAAAGQWLRAQGYQPDLVLCSAARRTRQTWQCLAETLGGRAEFRSERRLYQADAHDVAEVIRQSADPAAVVLYVGHNPAAAELAALLTGTEREFPTAAIAVIAVPGQWAGLTAGTGELIASWAPGPEI
jgi:phosphohistidine phosphatase